MIARAPVLILRPEPGAKQTLARARALGLDAHAFPLFAITPVAWQPVARDAVDALLLGSANALRHAGDALALYRGLPAYAVGQKTADAARNAGLDVVETGFGGLQVLLDRLRPGHLRLLRLCGRDRVTITVPAEVRLVTAEVYAAHPLPLPPELPPLLGKGAIVLLHSGEAAAHFATLCDKAGIARAGISLAAIGPRVAALAGTGWRSLRSADHPDDAALLAMAAQMCEEVNSGSQNSPEQG